MTYARDETSRRVSAISVELLYEQHLLVRWQRPQIIRK